MVSENRLEDGTYRCTPTFGRKSSFLVDVRNLGFEKRGRCIVTEVGHTSGYTTATVDVDTFIRTNRVKRITKADFVSCTWTEALSALLKGHVIYMAYSESAQYFAQVTHPLQQGDKFGMVVTVRGIDLFNDDFMSTWGDITIQNLSTTTFKREVVTDG